MKRFKDNMDMKKNRFTIPILCVFLFASCESLLEVDPPRSQVVSEKVFRTDATAEAAARGMYADMLASGHVFNGNNTSLLALAGLSSDELFHPPATSTAAVQFEENALMADNQLVLNLWGSMYQSVYAANALIERLEASTGVTESTKRQLTGEALFVRAFCHFYLVNLFGEAPLITTTDYRKNAQVSRDEVNVVYNQIEQDLLDVQELLDAEYPSDGRVRVNEGAATALLARVYLYREDWENAELQATSVIDHAEYDLVALNDITVANNNEAIWQLHRSSTVVNAATNEGVYFNIPSSYNALRADFINAFEGGDARSTEWIRFDGTYYSPDKYEVTSSGGRQEYSTMLRLAEQYLIRAEARAQQGGDLLDDAIDDVDAIRDRAGLPLIADTNPGINQVDLLDAIIQERRVELFTEWGHRWLDLKRTGRAVSVLSAIKTGFTSSDELYPIPQEELNNNPNLGSQNPD